MIELSGRLEPEQFGSILLFLAGLGHSGRLRVTRSPVAGDLDFHEGRVVRATCGGESGLDALQALVLVPGSIEFNFEGSASEQLESPAIDLAAPALGDLLGQLEPRRKRVAAAVPSLAARMQLLRQAPGREGEALTLTRRHFGMLFVVDGQRDARQLIEDQPLVVGLECLADLVEAGLVAVADSAESAVVGPRPESTSRVVTLPRGLQAPITLAGLKRPRLPRITPRRLFWTAMGVFIIVSGVLQWPDLTRQLQARSGLEGLSVPQEPTLPSDTPAVAPSFLSRASRASSASSARSAGNFWTASDGYHLAPRDPGRFLAVRPPVAAYGQDVLIGARFRKLSGAPGSSYGLIVRDQTPDGQDAASGAGRFLVFAVSDQGTASVRRWDGEQWITLMGATELAAPLRGLDSSLMQFEANGSQLTVRINGTEVSKVNDSSPAPGSIGLYAVGDGAEVVVDQLTLQVQ